ncbi:amidohydrolase family protein [Streptomyces sp. NPDC012421]|uniref:amidohydrolase family protein n=1 Tax=Streptomyces sp. NPDC012421 TaxID=3364832 RepID=UPI0036E11F00
MRQIGGERQLEGVVGAALRGRAEGRGLTGLMALEGMTTHAARAAGEEALTGRIAPGLRADLTALALDPTEAPADETAGAPVLLTVSGGRITFRS